MEPIDRSPRDRVISLTKGEFSSSSSFFFFFFFFFGGGGGGSSLGVWGLGSGVGREVVICGASWGGERRVW